VNQEQKLNSLATNISKMALDHAAERIVDKVFEIIDKNSSSK